MRDRRVLVLPAVLVVAWLMLSLSPTASARPVTAPNPAAVTPPAAAPTRAASPNPPTPSTPPPSASPAPSPSPVLTLQACVETGLRNNPTLHRQASVIRQAQAKTRETQGAEDFKINGVASYQVNQPEVLFGLQLPRGITSPQALVVPTTAYNVGVQITKLISNFGLLRDSVTLNALQADRAKLDLVVSRRDLVHAISAAYLQALRASRLLVLSREVEQGWRRHRVQAQDLYEHGAVPRYDVMQADVEVAKAGDQVIIGRRNVDVALATLGNRMALPAGSIDAARLEGTDVDAILRPEALTRLDRAAARDIAMARRVEMQLVDNLERQARTALSIARQGNNPSLVAGTSYNRKTPNFLYPDWAFQAGLTLNIPIISGRDLPARIVQARELIQQAEFTRQETALRIQLEVESAWLAFREAWQRQEAARVQLARAEEGLRVASLRYREGLSTGVEQVDAGTALAQARTNLANVRFDYLDAALNLEKAMGWLENGGLPTTP